MRDSADRAALFLFLSLYLGLNPPGEGWVNPLCWQPSDNAVNRLFIRVCFIHVSRTFRKSVGAL